MKKPSTSGTNEGLLVFLYATAFLTVIMFLSYLQWFA
jgi:hypothetical protein